MWTDEEQTQCSWRVTDLLATLPGATVGPWGAQLDAGHRPDGDEIEALIVQAWRLTAPAGVVRPFDAAGVVVLGVAEGGVVVDGAVGVVGRG